MEYTLASGSKLNVSPAEFGAANGLKKALMRCATPALLTAMQGKDKASLLKADMTMLLGPLSEALSNDDVEAAVFKCFPGVVSYNGEALKYDVFNSPDAEKQKTARKDYHEICYYVARANCEVFFEQILSLLKGAGLVSSTDTQKPA